MSPSIRWGCCSTLSTPTYSAVGNSTTDTSKVRPGGQSRGQNEVRFFTARSFCFNIYYLWSASNVKTEFINHAVKKYNFFFRLMVAAHSVTWPCDPCCDPYQLISATVDKKRTVDFEVPRLQERWKSQYFFY